MAINRYTAKVSNLATHKIRTEGSWRNEDRHSSVMDRCLLKKCNSIRVYRFAIALPRIASRGTIDFITGVDDDHMVQNDTHAACRFRRRGFHAACAANAIPGARSNLL